MEIKFLDEINGYLFTLTNDVFDDAFCQIQIDPGAQQRRFGSNTIETAFKLPDVLGQLAGQIVDDIVGHMIPVGECFFVQDSHPGPEIRRLNVGNQAAGQTRS